jgi:flagellar basal body P-ring protein FlgI
MDTLTALVGKRMISVIFIWDYMQFGFDDATITAVTNPTVSAGGHTLQLGEAGYRDRLCDQIGSIITSAAAVPDEEIAIGFSSGANLHISLKPDDYRAAEAVIIDIDDGKWAVW